MRRYWREPMSLAMGGGTDVARASGDMVLMGDQLALIPQALALSQNPGCNQAEPVVGCRV
jgi:hypothetical protein